MKVKEKQKYMTIHMEINLSIYWYNIAEERICLSVQCNRLKGFQKAVS